jgi:hypothetical protein
MYGLFFLAGEMECRKRFFVMNPAKFGMIIQMYAILEHGD